MLAHQLTTVGINFELKNHQNVPYTMETIRGENGILLAFTGDVWDVSCVRYMLWLQRQNFKLAALGVNCALIAPNQTYELNGFFMSIPRVISFPLLADPTKSLFDEVGMEKPGYLLLGHDGDVKARWYVNETASLSFRSVVYRLKSTIPIKGQLS